MSFSAEAGQKKKITGKTTYGTVVSRTIAYPGMPKHEMNQYVRVKDAVSSSDPDFDGGEQTTYGQWSKAGADATERGYFTILKDGDKAFAKYDECTWTIRTKEGGAWELSGSGKGKYIGGTGKFGDLKGTITFKFKLTPEGGFSDWEAEVEYWLPRIVELQLAIGRRAGSEMAPPSSFMRSVLYFRQDVPNHWFQSGQILDAGLPEHDQIHSKVLMRQLVSHP
jgi:hypothetical protein